MRKNCLFLAKSFSPESSLEALVIVYSTSQKAYHKSYTGEPRKHGLIASLRERGSWRRLVGGTQRRGS